eukprot:3555056-Alexandrium_andersonii.AAC.1
MEPGAERDQSPPCAGSEGPCAAGGELRQAQETEVRRERQPRPQRNQPSPCAGQEVPWRRHLGQRGHPPA